MFWSCFLVYRTSNYHLKQVTGHPLAALLAHSCQR